eukprot:gnl/MRDRNA2_/MRDRNA2_14997_c0_seq1.p1 gnl/MRDRNA2_/MRDRNA2_14997_c0~~gnl/MRDRNA2_/MRDRNA2_14997_c0_seq1.p1  ORF type:complete len:350 (-),score=62.43 gnl/MRDRNA2_/MRDRNA2_14997_c0_seq1:14-943(-)
MTIAVKGVFVHQNFTFPKFVTGIHFLFCGILCFGIMIYKHVTGSRKFVVPSMKQQYSLILPIAVAFAASVGTNNIALVHANAAFAEMIGGAAPLCIICIAMFEGKPFNLKLVLPIVCVIAGVWWCASGESKFSLFGFLLLFLSTFLRAYKSHLQYKTMEDYEQGQERLDPIELCGWMSPPCLAVMLIWGGMTEGFEPIMMLGQGKGLEISLAIGVTVVNACILNVANNFVIRDLGAIGCLLAGQLKGILVLLGASVLLEEVIQPQQIAGYVLIVAGVYFYNQMEKQIKDEAQSDSKTDIADLEKIPLVK